MNLKKQNIKGLYNLPNEIKFCTKCVISNQRPRITFDENGVCSACNFAEFKKNKIDWDKRLVELKKLCDAHRKADGSYDVIVPCSGGKLRWEQPQWIINAGHFPNWNVHI